MSDTSGADNRATIGDIEVAWTEAGPVDGRPVVLVHGLAEARATWAVQQAELDDVHTYAYDLRGHGQTTVGDAEASLEQLGRDLIGFLEAVSGPAVVVGFSFSLDTGREDGPLSHRDAKQIAQEQQKARLPQGEPGLLARN